MIINEHGWLQTTDCIQCVPSPNYDKRPTETTVDLLVIHHISLPPHTFGGSHIADFFCNQLDEKAHPYFKTIATIKVSAHILIKRNGSIIQFVSFNNRAWHAGKSCYNNRTLCNDFSIGIELEGDETSSYRYAQYKQLARLTRLLQITFPHIKENIVGHSDIAPERKRDPGPTFDWCHYRHLIQPSDVQPSDVQPSDAQSSRAQPSRATNHLV